MNLNKKAIKETCRVRIKKPKNKDVRRGEFNSSTDTKNTEKDRNFNKCSYHKICSRYVPVLKNYPAVKDPGIRNALLNPEPQTTYHDDGQDLYIDICKEMSIVLINIFHRSLLSDKIDLSYYGVDKKNFRAIALTLQRNIFVSILDLTDNWMDLDSCYHIGEMLSINEHITELNLEGCNIGASGAEVFFHFIPRNRSLIKLNLSKNKLNDEGARFVIKAIEQNVSLKDLNLSYNNLSTITAAALVEVLEFRNFFTHLDLSWNSKFEPNIINKLCRKLAQNDKFETINLSWNSLSDERIGLAIKALMAAKSIKTIILNNNYLSGNAIEHLVERLARAKKLDTLDLSYNPLTIQDAILLLDSMRSPKIKLRCLLLDNVMVNEEFMKIRDEILSLNDRKDTIITHGYVRPSMFIQPTDMRYILLKRAYAINITEEIKKDFALSILKMSKEDPAPRRVDDFRDNLRTLGIYLDKDLLEQFAEYFNGPEIKEKKKMIRTVCLEGIKEYIKRIWPEKEMPPTPSPKIKLPKNQRKLRKKLMTSKLTTTGYYTGK